MKTPRFSARRPLSSPLSGKVEVKDRKEDSDERDPDMPSDFFRLFLEIAVTEKSVDEHQDQHGCPVRFPSVAGQVCPPGEVEPGHDDSKHCCDDAPAFCETAVLVNDVCQSLDRLVSQGPHEDNQDDIGDDFSVWPRSSNGDQ